MDTLDLEHVRIYFKQFGAERVNTFTRILTHPQQTTVENTVAKGKVAHSEQFIVSYCMQLFWVFVFNSSGYCFVFIIDQVRFF